MIRVGNLPNLPSEPLVPPPSVLLTTASRGKLPHMFTRTPEFAAGADRMEICREWPLCWKFFSKRRAYIR